MQREKDREWGVFQKSEAANSTSSSEREIYIEKKIKQDKCVVWFMGTRQIETALGTRH